MVIFAWELEKFISKDLGYSFNELLNLQAKISHDRPRPIFKMGGALTKEKVLMNLRTPEGKIFQDSYIPIIRNS